MRDYVTVLPHAVFRTLAISVPSILEAARGEADHARFDRRLRDWAGALVEHVGMRVHVRGREHVAPGEAYVVMSNHQSHYDIPVIFVALPMLSIRMVAKAGLFRVPIWGRALRVAGFVPVDRSDRAQAIGALAAARQALAQGISIWIAPEGTRARDGRLGRFKQGGFHLALESGARILPVSIDGTYAALPANTRRVRRGVEVRVTIHRPVDPASFGPERRAELVEAVRASIASALANA